MWMGVGVERREPDLLLLKRGALLCPQMVQESRNVFFSHSVLKFPELFHHSDSGRERELGLLL